MNINILINNSLNSWFKAHKLSQNTNKSFFIIFHRSKIKSNVINKVVIDNHELTQVSSVKYLGVIIAHKLNWIEHISYVRNKISMGIGIMYKTRQFLTKKSFSYVGTCLHLSLYDIINCLLLLQEKLIEIMSFSHYITPTISIFPFNESSSIKENIFLS